MENVCILVVVYGNQRKKYGVVLPMNLDRMFENWVQ
jgi:hypothetical protein